MTAEPRTLRTKAEEALAALYRGGAREPARRRRGARPAERRLLAVRAVRPAASPGRSVEIHRPPHADAHASPPLAGVAAGRAAGGGRRGRPARQRSTGRRSSSPTASSSRSCPTSPAPTASRSSRSPMCWRPSPERVGRLFDDGDDTVMALNTALMQGGVVVTVAAGAQPARPIEIVHLTAGDAPVSVFTRDVVDVGEGALVRFLESHRGPAGLAYQVNALTELAVGDGAAVNWVAAPGRERGGAASRELRRRGSARARPSTTSRSIPARRWRAGRLSSRSPASGPGSPSPARPCSSGTEHGDSTLVVTHAEPHGASRELFKIGDRRPGDRRLPGQDHRRAGRAEDRRQDDGARRCSSPTRRSSPRSRSSRSSPTTCSAATARPRARSTTTSSST